MHSVSQLLDEVNKQISSINFTFTRSPKELYEPVEYVLSLGGKRLRPVLTLAAYNLYHSDLTPALKPALGIETYHNYTLLHDDVMDRADLRRGKPTVHTKWNDNVAILSGDAMLVLAYQYVAACDEKYLKAAIGLFSQTALEICEGQQMDMNFEQRNNVTEEEYIEMIRLKTGVLLAASLKLGAILAGAPQEDADRLYRFGMQMGIAFQLQDDLLDVYGDPKVFGKKIGGDILCNKKTYLLIQALKRAGERVRRSLNLWLQAKGIDEGDKIRAVTNIYDKLGIRAECEERINQFYAEGMRNFSELEVDDERKAVLKELVESLMFRRV